MAKLGNMSEAPGGGSGISSPRMTGGITGKGGANVTSTYKSGNVVNNPGSRPLPVNRGVKVSNNVTVKPQRNKSMTLEERNRLLDINSTKATSTSGNARGLKAANKPTSSEIAKKKASGTAAEYKKFLNDVKAARKEISDALKANKNMGRH
jgi:hypothetical protein